MFLILFSVAMRIAFLVIVPLEMRLAIGMPVIGSRFGILAEFLTSLTSAVIRIKVRSYILKAFNAAGFISHLIEGRGARGSRCRVPNKQA